MIPDAILALVGLIFDGLAALLPEWELPYLEEITEWVEDMAGYVRALIDDVFPIDAYLAIVRDAVLVWFAAMTTFIVVRWFYRHVPVIGAG
ncbi:MAG: hypothetical protein U1C73_06355 [Dietzia sp.]|nr:hypothetical protein [Dietzia sp.]